MRPLMLLPLASVLGAQTPALPCDSASVLMRAQPVFNVGTVRIREACPAFARSIRTWYDSNALRVALWTPAQVVDAITRGPRPTPVDTGVSPEPTATSVILWRDDFDRPSATIRQRYGSRGSEAITAVSAAPLPGNAVRFNYASNANDLLLEFSHPEVTDVFVRYNYRVSPSAVAGLTGRTGSGFKWLMAWRGNGLPRYSMGVTFLGKGNAGLEFGTHDNSSARMPDPVLQTAKARRFATTSDGTWHLYTLHLVTGAVGYEEIWIDGTLVLSSRGAGYDHNPAGIVMWQFPGAVVDGVATAFTVDVKNLVVWRN